MRVVVTGFVESDNGTQFAERFSASVKAAKQPSALPPLPHDVEIVETAVHAKYLAARLSDGRVARIAFTLPAAALTPSKPPIRLPSTSTREERRRPHIDELREQANADFRADIRARHARLSGLDELMDLSMPSYMEEDETEAEADESWMESEDPLTSYMPSPAAAARSGSGARPPAALIEQVTSILPDKSEAEVVRALQRARNDVEGAINLLMQDDDQGEASESATSLPRHRHEFLAAAMAARRHSVRGPPPRRQDYRAPWEGLHTITAAQTALMQESANREASFLRLLDMPTTLGHYPMAGQRRSASDDIDLSVIGMRAPSGEASSHAEKPSSAPVDISPQWDSTWTFWSCPGGSFVRLGGMHSELLAVGSNGQLYSWPWENAMGGSEPHERSQALGLIGQEVRLLSTSSYRASMVLGNGDIVTMADRKLHDFNPGGLLACEHTARSLSQGSGTVVQMVVTNDVTVLQLSDHTILRFGFKAADELKAQLRAQVDERKSRKGDDIMRVGDTVALRACPAFRPGVIAFNPRLGVAGRLLDNAWDLTATCRFELKDKTVLEWQLGDVQVLETGLGAKAGQVLKADGNMVAVYFPADHGNDVEDHVKWSHARLLNQKQLFKTTCCDSAVWSEDPMLATCVDNSSQRCQLPANVTEVLAASVVDRWTLVLLATTTSTASASNNEASPTIACYQLPATSSDLNLPNDKVKGGPLSTPIVVQRGVSILPGPTIGSVLLQVDNALLSLTVTKTQAQVGPTLNVGVAHGVAYTSIPQSPEATTACFYLQSAVCPPQELAEAVANADMSKVEAILADEERRQGAVAQYLDGRRNVLHVAVAGSRKAMPGALSPLHEARRAARDVLTDTLCRELKGQMPLLLGQLDVCGRTAFQSALLHAAYHPAVTMVKAVKAMFPDHPFKQEATLTGKSTSTLSPLHHLLATPICTGTRLGRTRIAQHVFECHTCELKGRSCVCLSCAMTCHAGHDLAYSQYARDSYCDCAGHSSCVLQDVCVGKSSDRDALVQVLLSTSAALATNSLGETILMTMLRQQQEIASLKPTTGKASAYGSAGPSPTIQGSTKNEVKEEEQARLVALAQVAQSWDVLLATFGGAAVPGQLDQCVHALLQPRSASTLEHIVLTILLAVEARREDALAVASALVKSIVRVFVVHATEDMPGENPPPTSGAPSPYPHGYPLRPPMHYGGARSDAARSAHRFDEKDSLCQAARRVLRTFLPLALPELAEAADAIITPVRLGLVTPAHGPSPAASTARPESERYMHYREQRDSREERGSASTTQHADVTQNIFDRRENGGTSVFDLAPTTRDPSSEAETDPHDAAVREARDELLEAHGFDTRDRWDRLMAGQASSTTPYGWAFEEPAAPATARPASRRRRNAMEATRRTTSEVDAHGKLGNFETHKVTVQLARAYRRTLRCLTLVADGTASATPGEYSQLAMGLDPELYSLGFETADAVLTRTWLWLATCMDGLEAQLQHGQSTMDRQTPKHRTPGQATTTQESGVASYVLNLLRGHSNEAQRSRPVVNIAATAHIAYAFDALMLYSRVRGSLAAKVAPVDGAGRSFFSRTESIVSGGLVQDSQLDLPLAEALPLARHPHALGPDSSRHDLFGDGPITSATADAKRSPRHPSLSRRSKPAARRASSDGGNFTRPKRPKLSSPLPSPRLSPVLGSGLSNSTRRQLSVDRLKQSWRELYGWSGPGLPTMTVDVAAERWQALVQLYVEHFTPTVGKEPGSVLNSLAGFEIQEANFWANMEQVRSSSSQGSELRFTVERTRSSLILTTMVKVLSFGMRAHSREAHFRPSGFGVSFENELGEGNGVVRAFYAAFADAVTHGDDLPPITTELVSHLRQQQDGELRRNSGRRERRTSVTLQASSTSIQREHLGEKLRAVSQYAPPHAQQDMLVAIVADDAIRSGYAKDLEEATRLGQQVASQPAHQRDMRLTEADSIASFFSKFDSRPPSAKRAPSTRASPRQQPRRPLDCTGVLFCPGNPGYFSLRPGQYYGHALDISGASSQEDGLVSVNAYRLALCNTIGRLAGLSLRQRDLFPLRLSRHVLKYLLGREVAFHDLAFFDPAVYEAQRQLLNDYKEAGDDFEDLDLCFTVKLRPEMGGADVELVPDGKEVEVNPNNVTDYVQRYAKLLMIDCVKDELEALKTGFLEVIPANLLSELTAEDLRLLLNGRDHVDLKLLKTATAFRNECSDSPLFKLTQERFWRVVEDMSQKQQQDLIYFWMSIPSLPATQRGLVPRPVVVVRPQTEDLPTAATCSANLSVPAYASEAMLKEKLLMAIATKSFGFI
eukprot:m.249252 g.249252  ORF g.249252 m.249252 type:complete len:2302 (+) comp17511_c0_seq1:143-7048(+)